MKEKLLRKKLQRKRSRGGDDNEDRADSSRNEMNSAEPKKTERITTESEEAIIRSHCVVFGVPPLNRDLALEVTTATAIVKVEMILFPIIIVTLNHHHRIHLDSNHPTNPSRHHLLPPINREMSSPESFPVSNLTVPS
jgi:hypothetical protein